MKTRNRIPAVILCAGLSSLGACAGHAPHTAEQSQAEATQTDQAAPTAAADRDPLERSNRAIFKFNRAVDRAVLKPVSGAYDKLPRPVRSGIGNFFSNLGEPNTILNDLLQGKWGYAGQDTGRFMVNSTFGLLGLFDVAAAFGLPRRNEDFGQTLAVWGVPPGPYLMLPLLGPSNLRDAAGLVPQNLATDPVNALESPERSYALGLRVVDARSRNSAAIETLELQPDPYLFLRQGYRQRRDYLIHDGHPPQRADHDLIDELLEDEGEDEDAPPS